MKFLSGEKGSQSEKITCGYLVDNVYKVFGQDFWLLYKKIDIITKSRVRTLVFVTAKTIHRHGHMAVTMTGRDTTNGGQKKSGIQELYIIKDNLTAKKWPG